MFGRLWPAMPDSITAVADSIPAATFSDIILLVSSGCIAQNPAIPDIRSAITHWASIVIRVACRTGTIKSKGLTARICCFPVFAPQHGATSPGASSGFCKGGLSYPQRTPQRKASGNRSPLAITEGA